MKANNIGLLIVVSSFAVGCSTPEVKPPVPVARPIEMPTPRVKPKPKPRPKPIKTPYSAKVDRYSDNVAVKAQEVDGKTSIMSKQDAARKIDEESDRLDPYLSKSGKSGVTGSASASAEESGTSTAVMALMLRAKVDMLAGRSDAAIDKLERGLRIQPNNPDLWNKLAEAHFHKGSYKQASSMAKKSISLTSRNNTDLLRRNWKLVANARKKMGDMQGMQDAMRASSSL